MQSGKGRRALYTEATREALLIEATRLFAERGFSATSLDQIAAAASVTRGAVYHHFASKKALFETVLDRLGSATIQRVLSVAQRHDDAALAALAALDAFLTESCDFTYGKLIWQEGPLALGWEGWRRCEHHHSYAFVEDMVAALMRDGYLERVAEETTARVFYEMLSGAGLAIAESDAGDKKRVRDECFVLLQRLLGGLLLRHPASNADATAR